MKLFYGDYEHQLKSATPRVSSVPLETPQGLVYAIRQTIAVQGELQGETTTDVKDAVAALIDAYAEFNKEFIWKFNDDSETPDVHLVPANCIGGVKVIQRPSFTAGEGGEYSNYRRYELVVQGDVKITGNDFPRLWSFQQTISRTGNGRAEFRHVRLKNERWQKQQTARYTPVTVSQSGSIVGTLQHLPAPAPKWPYALLSASDSVSIDEHPQQWINGTGVGYARSWNYQFESNAPLPGAP